MLLGRHLVVSGTLFLVHLPARGFGLRPVPPRPGKAAVRTPFSCGQCCLSAWDGKMVCGCGSSLISDQIQDIGA